MREKVLKKRMVSGAGALVLLLVFLLCPLSVSAAEPRIQSVDIEVALQSDGSALITELWEVTPKEGTEWYLAKYNLDNQEISDLSVTDENGTVFQDVGEWDPDDSFEEKTGKSGLAQTRGGYELCWGLGSYEDHVYTVRYRMTNLVKGYDDADAITQQFVPENMASEVENVRIALSLPGQVLSEDNAGAWVFGFSADYWFENGSVFVQSDSAMQTNHYAAVMLRLDKGLVSPLDVRDESFESIRDEGFKGSDYIDGGGFFNKLFRMGERLLPYLGIAVVGIIAMARKKSGKGSSSREKMKPEYKNPQYSRELPFDNVLSAAYTRLDDLNQLPNDGTIIGAYLLRWVRSRQVELVKFEKSGLFSSKEEDAIKLYDARPGMDSDEKALYSMLITAAGKDWILQSKEFEKWSQKNYQKVQSWMERYKNVGHEHMRAMGAATEVDEKAFFGLTTVRKTVMTPQGETQTVNLFGFKKYLEDFTIINEREAREVQLWDDYLVYAQVFGIADKVAEQFKNLYPDYFTQMATQMGGNIDMYDVFLLTRMANNYSWAMSRGYHNGYNAAQAARYSGGGGHSSMGGGGGFSGGSGGFSGGGTR